MTTLDTSPAAISAAEAALTSATEADEGVRRSPTHPRRYELAGVDANANFLCYRLKRQAMLAPDIRLSVEHVAALNASADADAGLAEFTRDVPHVACSEDSSFVHDRLVRDVDDPRVAPRALNAAEEVTE